ncbi:MAG: GAF domain-containing protein [bacterium]|nr:GAF domain-containing protein [bacterium]
MKKIIIIDNDTVAVKALADIVSRESYVVFRAYDGVEGLESIRAHLPEVAIIDLFMPGIDGIRLCRYLKSDPEFEGMKVIVLSPLTGTETHNVMTIEADMYVAKGYIMDVADNVLRGLKMLADKNARISDENRMLGFEGRSPRVVVEELLTERRHYENTMHNVGDGILEFDHNGTVMYVNPAAKKILQREEMSIIGYNISDVLEKRYDGQFQEILQRLGNAGELTNIEITLGYAKKTLDFNFANILSKDGEYSGSLIILQDVSYLTGRIRELTLLNDVGRILTSTLDFNEVLHIVMSQIQRIMEVEAISLLLVEKETKDLIFEVALGMAGPSIKHKRLTAGKGIVGWVARKGKPLLLPDVYADSRFDHSIDESTGFKTQSMICVPMKIRDEVIGVIQVINRGNAVPFNEDNMYLLSSISMYASIAIEHANLYQELHERQQ